MASEVSKPPLVRCPKCRRLLMEIADIPVYKCGGCGTILQTKTRRANMEISHTGCRVEENPSCSTSENKSHEEESNNFSEEEPPACRETADMEAGSTPNIRYSAGRSAVMAVDTISVSSAPQSQLDGSCKLSRHGSANSSSSYKMGECTESVLSEEETFDGNPGNSQIHNVGTSIARSSHAYEGGVSSGDDISGNRERYRLLSRRTFRNRTASESSSTGTRDGKEDTFPGNKQAASSSEMYDAGALGISGLERGSPSRNAAHTSDPDASPGFVNLYPVQNEQESDHLSSLSGSPSRGSTSLEDFPCNGSNGTPSTRLENLQSDRIEPQRRVDLLRYQPARTYGGGRRGGQRVPVGGRPPLFSNLGSEQVPTTLCNGDMSKWQSRSSGRTTIDPRYQSSGIPLSAQGNGYCLPHHHHHPDIPGHLPSSIYCRACSSGTWSHPSTAATSGRPEVDRDASLCHGSEASDYRTRIVPGKEKRHHKKRRHCRPVSGGAPFVVCNECSELLQLPVDFLVSRGRHHKLRCGACSEVLTFLYHGGHVVPLSSAQVDPSPRGVHTSMDDASKHEQNSLPEDPVSYSEEYGPPPSQSYSTDGEPCILRSSPEQKGKGRYKQRMGPALHHLLGYDSARDLVFLPGDEDERCESMDLSSFHRALDYVDDEHYGGTGTRSPAQERPSVGYSPNQSEIQEEEEPVMRLAGARGGPPPRGIIGGDTDELNHGLNNMKLRPQKNGRPW